MKIVVTGASGFIGSALMIALKQSDHHCIGFSRSSNDGVVKICSYSDIPLADVLVHTAEVSSQALANKLGQKYEKEASALLSTLIKKKYGRVLYLSSGAVYGDSNEKPHKESDRILPVGVYGRVKAVSEQIVLDNAGTVIRLANTIGFGMARENVLSEIISQLGTPGPIQIRQAAPIRDFVWKEDVIEGISKLVESNQAGIFNIGSGIGVSIGQLAKNAVVISRRQNKQVFSMQESNTLSCLILDHTKITNTLGWQPRTNLSEALSLLINNSRNKEVFR